MALKREYRPPLNSNELKYSKILSRNVVERDAPRNGKNITAQEIITTLLKCMNFLKSIWLNKIGKRTSGNNFTPTENEKNSALSIVLWVYKK